MSVGGEVESVFRTDNNTNVVAHRGSTTTLNCQVVKDSQYGVVSPQFSSSLQNIAINS